MLNQGDHDLLIQVMTRIEERGRVFEQVRSDLQARNDKVDAYFARLEAKIDSIPRPNGRTHAATIGAAGTVSGAIVTGALALARQLGWW